MGDIETNDGRPAPPTEKDLIKAAIDELIGESKRWLAAADDMETVTGKVKNLRCESAAFSFIGIDVGLDSSYEKLRSEFERITRKAERNLEYLGQALKTAAARYEEEDRENKHRLDNAADWRI